MQQQTFDFEAIESQTTAETEQQQPLTDSPSHPDYIRPDRQEIFENLSCYEWPAPQRDRDTITVDRIYGGPEIGLTHRFTIKRDDTVRAYFNNRKTEVGQVVGISHAKQKVKVRFKQGTQGIWFHKGAILPQTEPEPTLPKVVRPAPLSVIVAEYNSANAPSDGFTEVDLIHPPYSFDEFKEFYPLLLRGSTSFAEYHTHFKRLSSSKTLITEDLVDRLNAKQLKALASNMGDFNARTNTMQANAHGIYQKMLSSFLLDGTVSFAMGESYTDAVTAKINAVTQENWNAHFANESVKQQELEMALANPQTLYDFSRLIQRDGQDALTHEQLALWDSLHADLTRERRAENGSTKTVLQFEAEELEGYEFTIIEGYHTKRECPLWIVQLSTRVERTTFNELNGKAKMLGGRFSSFKKDEVGFQFYDFETATKFTELLGGDTDRTDILERRQQRREMTAAERLHELADTMLERADETIAASEQSLQNTARRAGIQAGVRGRAYADQALARSLHSVAEALSTGTAKYLDGIRHKTHLEALDSTFYLAKLARIRTLRKASSEQGYGYGLRLQEEEEKPYSEDDIRFTEYPQPTIYKPHLEQAILHCCTRKGAKMISERMRKRIRRSKGDIVTFTGDADIAQLADFLSRAKAAGYDTQWMDRSLERYKRLQAAHLGDIHELRAVLREYLPHKASVRGDDPVQMAERELIGKNLPGFFPTPKSIIQYMLKYAEIEPHHHVLEPSCGKGDIVTFILTAVPEAQITALEMNRSLAEVLAAKSIAVEFTDFLVHQGQYERIVMNPPFERGADIDHVQHAYDCLAAGGRLVSVMSEGPFGRSDKKSAQFQRWLYALGGYSIKLPEDAFKTADAFRQTGVRTRLLVIDKE